MYHPYIRQKIFEARARELERIAEQDRTARGDDARPGRFERLKPTSGRRRASYARPRT